MGDWTPTGTGEHGDTCLLCQILRDPDGRRILAERAEREVAPSRDSLYRKIQRLKLNRRPDNVDGKL